MAGALTSEPSLYAWSFLKTFKVDTGEIETGSVLDNKAVRTQAHPRLVSCLESKTQSAPQSSLSYYEKSSSGSPPSDPVDLDR